MKPFYWLSLMVLYATQANSAVNNDWQSLLTEDQRATTVSFNMAAAPLPQVFKILAAELDLNLIISDDIKGESSLSLKNVKWVDAMTSLADSHELHIRLQGNVIWISEQPVPTSQISATQPPELIPINFAKASDLADLLRNSEQSFLSANGVISVDQRTNTLIVSDNKRKLSGIKSLIKKLDVPVKQVMIEARMVSLKTNIADELGVRWGASREGLSPAEDSQFIQGMQVNLPTASPAATVGLNVATLSDDILLDLELTALERENKGEIIASPKIFTANQQPAYIEQGTEIPYVESAASGATAVQFKKAVMGLKVTPQITPNDHVLLDLTITQNTRGDTVSTPTGPAVAIDTQEMATRVLVKDGETIVLGGIFQTLELKDMRGVPMLSSIPLLGHLFEHRQQRKEKRELLIFVTPTLLTNTE